MVRFMVVTFAFLAWAFYVMSGGADFDPDRARLDNSRSDPLKTAEAPEAPADDPGGDEIEVTRVSLDLTSVEDVLSGDDEAEPSRLPQQTTSSRLPQQTTPGLQSGTGDETARIIPSLIENASPEGVLSDADSGDSTTAEQASLDTSADIRVVSGSRVNVRNGPGTTHGVVGTLVAGDRVEVLDDAGTGWVRMRAADSGTMGWMADFLLTDG